MATVTKTIGTNGRDYSTISGWEADLDDTAIYSSGDDAVGECYNDSEFDPTDRIIIDGGDTVGINSVTLSVAEGERHDGSAGTGAKIAPTSDIEGYLLDERQRASDLLLEWIEVDLSGNGDSKPQFISFFHDEAEYTVRRSILHSSETYESENSVKMITLAGTTGSAFHNNICYDYHETYTGSGGDRCWVSAINSNIVNIYSNTIHDIDSANSNGTVNGILFGDDSERDIQNNLVTDVTGDTADDTVGFSPSAVSNATANHNASSDATASGTGSLTNIVTADQYVSTVSGSEDLHLKSGSDCIDAGADLGTTPIGVEIDIDGRDRDAEGDTWDIGADEFVSLINYVPPPSRFQPIGALS